MVQFLVGYGLGVEQGRPRPEDSQKPAATGGESLVYPLVEATDRFPASLWEQDSDSSCDAPRGLPVNNHSESKATAVCSRL